jgi:hypothetical protein
VKHDAARAFLGELVDDAGLFPPARLPMDDALGANERALASDAFWLVGRFVVPASRFAEMIAALDEAPRPLPVSVVLDGASPATSLSALGREARASESRVALEALEVPLSSIPGDTDDARLVALERELAAAYFPDDPAVYVELPPGDDAEERLLAIHRARARGFSAFAKVRCGGLQANAVPPVAALAHFIWTANRLDVPFKATAGLHHALPFDDASIDARTHGFLNVIGGAVLAYARGIDRHTLELLLADRDPENFRLDAATFAWSGIGADASEIGAARERFVHSYGSCSLDEPVADLRGLGMLSALVR